MFVESVHLFTALENAIFLVFLALSWSKISPCFIAMAPEKFHFSKKSKKQKKKKRERETST